VRKRALLCRPIVEVRKKSTVWQMYGFVEFGGTRGVIASNGGFAGVSLDVGGTGAQDCTCLGFIDRPGGWGVKDLWCIPMRG